MKKEVKKNLSFYNKNAELWADRKINPFSLEKQFIKFTKYFKKGANIIDIGCAAGAYVPLFMGLGRNLKYEGFDLSKNLISIAKRHFPQFKFYVADLLDTKSFLMKKYEGFWASAVLMHIPETNWFEMLNNISKICKPKAVGFILIPKEQHIPNDKNDSRFFAFFDKKKLIKMLNQVNWKIIESGFAYTNNVGDWHWYLVRLP
jgi:2-polyprenyl-3-methyl-5-hydroxy-6-metoxy-1,4-benzoquinol methylase